ncbi:hnRNP A1-gamma isoform [Pisolithus albus]|nr:hnRNP A1-gamma isoform [Pisolithus albus]
MAAEKKDNADSDLYGDLYDDGFTIPLDDDGQPSSESFEILVPEDDQTLSESTEKPLSSDNISLPAKPSSTADPSGLSYSAQVAKQFSAYQQTTESGATTTTLLFLHLDHLPSRLMKLTALRADRPIRPSEMKDEGKMFIGGLSWDTTDEGLKKYFSTVWQESVNAVLAQEHTLDGKTIDPKRAIPREEHLRNTRYFVGGLSHATTADSMRDFFSAYGKVVDATVMVDRETGRSKGFGFVTFEDSSNQERFVGKLGLILDDKEIEVKMAQPRSQRDQARNVTSRDGYSDQDARHSAATPMTFNPQQAANPAASMMYQRMMNQMPMANGGGGPVGMMNPMLMGMGMGGMNMGATGMGMAMNNLGGMGLGGMGMMGGGVNPMMAMNPMGMRMGMGGPMAMGMMQPGAAGGMGMGNVGMRMRQGMGMGDMMGMNAHPGAMSMSSGPGPSRMPSRVRHTFHPYAR